LFQGAAIPLEILHGVVFIHTVGLEEAVEPVPGSKT
jgi:hypothetical protein